MTPKVLLLQARVPDDPMREQEKRCFVLRTGLPPENIACHNLHDGALEPSRLGDYDALMVGGSGAYYVSRRNLPQFDAFLKLLREVVRAGRPMFASCFGYQALVAALGGAIVSDPANREVGTYGLTLTAEGRRDELFGRLPQRVMAQMGHTDRVGRPAEGVINLASSERCSHQALRVPLKPIWASQFHPELGRKHNSERFRTYMAAYGSDEDKANLPRAMRRFRESPETSSLLRAFLDLVFDRPRRR